jgi:hypothetical protein
MQLDDMLPDTVNDALHDTRSIPDDAGYWSSLADRVAARARARPRTAVAWLGARNGTWFAAASLVAAVAVGWAVRGWEPGRGEPGDVAGWARMVARDPQLVALAAPDRPPSVAALLFDRGAR